MNRVMQLVHNNGVLLSDEATVKQVYVSKGTIIGSLLHLGTKHKVIQQTLGVWSVQSG